MCVCVCVGVCVCGCVCVCVGRGGGGVEGEKGVLAHLEKMIPDRYPSEIHLQVGVPVLDTHQTV